MKFPNIANARFACRGLWVALSQETQVLWLLILNSALFTIAVARGETANELLILGVVFSFTIAIEIFNGCIERICDLVHPEKDVRIKDIKDLAAGATLFISLVSLAAWFVVIFLHA